jgi:hypothetical protein
MLDGDVGCSCTQVQRRPNTRNPIFSKIGEFPVQDCLCSGPGLLPGRLGQAVGRRGGLRRRGDAVEFVGKGGVTQS